MSMELRCLELALRAVSEMPPLEVGGEDLRLILILNEKK